MDISLSRRTLLQGALTSSVILTAPSLMKAADADVLRIGYFLPPEEQLQKPSQYSWIAPANIAGMCLEPLVRIGGENQIDYVLAERIYSDADGIVWFIDLKPNVLWQDSTDGITPLTAEQVAANIKNWHDDLDSPLGHQFRDFVKEISVDSGTRIRVTLKSPNYQFLYVFTSYAALIMHPDDNWTFTGKSKRTGPFKMLSYESKKEAKFEPVPNYWNVQQRATMSVMFLHDDGSIDRSFDFTPQLDPDRGPSLKAKGFGIKQNPLADTLVFHMDCRSGELSDPKVRRALRMCLDPQKMLESIYGFGRASDHTHAFPLHQDFPKDWMPSISFEPEEAKVLIEGKSLKFPLHYLADNLWQKNAVEAYVLQAKHIGVEIVPTPCLREEFDTNWDKYPGLTAIKWIHRPLAMQLYHEVYLSTAKWNLSGWKNDEFDQQVNELQTTPLTNTDKISIHARRAMEIMQDDGPMVQAAWIDCNKAYDPRRLNVASVQVGSGGFIYAHRLRRA